MFKIHAFILTAFLTCSTVAQKREVQIIASGGSASFRGMSIPNDDVIWVSGSNGTVGKSVDAGKTWRFFVVPGFEKRDFRDIEAFDSSTAIIMAIDNPAYILKTIDGGLTWKKTFEKNEEGMFLDAMDFRNAKEGICIGDPLTATDGRKHFYIIRTYDGGDTWNEVAMQLLPPAQNEEAIFSASGTNIHFLNRPDFEYAFVTGGQTSNLFMIGKQGKRSKVIHLPLRQGVPSAGTFSLATDGKKKFYCIGGNYKEPTDVLYNFYWSNNGGKRWSSASTAPPSGYRSCIQIIDRKKLVSCGTNGVDYCSDGGNTWKNVTKEGFNVCMISPKRKVVFLAGEKGKIGKLIY